LAIAIHLLISIKICIVKGIGKKDTFALFALLARNNQTPSALQIKKVLDIKEKKFSSSTTQNI